MEGEPEASSIIEEIKEKEEMIGEEVQQCCIVAHHVTNDLSPKHLHDFFVTYCGPIAFLAFDREQQKALVYFELEPSRRAALVLGRSYINGIAVSLSGLSPSLSSPPLSPSTAFPSPSPSPLPVPSEMNLASPSLLEQLRKYLRSKEMERTERERKEKELQEQKEREREEKEKEKENQVPSHISPIPSPRGEAIPEPHPEHEPARFGIDFEQGVVSYMGKGILYNFRDIAYFPMPHGLKQQEADKLDRNVLTNVDGKKLKSGVLYRSACWTRPGNITAEEVKEVFDFLFASTRIMTLIDLRARREKVEDPLDKVVEQMYPTFLPTPVLNPIVAQRKKRYAIDLVTRKMQFKGLLWGATPSSVYFQMMYHAMGRRRASLAVPPVSGQTPHQQGLALAAASSRSFDGDTRQQQTPNPFAVASASGRPSATTNSAATLQNDQRRHSLASTSTSSEFPDNKWQESNGSTATSSTTTTTTTNEPEPIAVGGEVNEGDVVAIDHESKESSEDVEDDPTKQLEELMEPFLESETNALNIEDDKFAIKDPETLQQVFVQGVLSPMGLIGLNKLLVVHAPREIGTVLKLISNPQLHPILFHCSSGKDRTGLIAALVLTICRIPRQKIIDSYHLSELYLSPVMDEVRRDNRDKGLEESFDGTPKFVMRDTLEYIEEKFESIEAWLATQCLFSIPEQAALRKFMLLPRPVATSL